MDKIKEYAVTNYPKTFKNKQIIVMESKSCYFVSTNKDASPLILSKNII